MVVTNLCPNTCMEEMKAMENCNAWPMIPSLTGKDLLTRQVDALDATQDHYRTHLDAAAPIITTKLSRGQKHTTTKWIHLIAFALFFHLSNFFFSRFAIYLSENWIVGFGLDKSLHVEGSLSIGQTLHQ